MNQKFVFSAGVRFYMRGTDNEGNSANFIETEQIVEFDGHEQSNRCIASFIQVFFLIIYIL